MKQTRKVLALVLALTMILGLATSVFAAPGHTHTITINNTVSGYSYTAYQIFTGTLGHDGVLSDVEWGADVDSAKLLTELNKLDAYKTCATAKDVAKVLSLNGATDDEDAILFAEIVAGCLKSTNSGTSSWDGSKYTIPNMDDGYYLVVNDGTPSGTNTTVSRYILEVVRDVTVAHKGDFPTVDKKILEGADKVTKSEAAMGEKITFVITGTIPDNIADYDTYYYVFTDTMSKGLTFDRTPTDPNYTPDTVQVTVNGVDVTKYFYIGNTPYHEENGTTITVGMEDLLTLENITEDLDPATEGVQTVGKITDKTEVIFTYTAELNQNAVIAGEGNPNVVDLEYSNDPNVDGDGSNNPPPTPEYPEPKYPTGETPEKQTITYTTKLTLQKVDGAGVPLTGAEFTLTGTAVESSIVTGGRYVEVEENTGTHYMLKDGKYTTTAPTYDNPDTTINESTTDLYATLTKDYIIEQFEEYVETDKAVEIKGFVDANGQLVFEGLGAGEYILEETVVPTGFNKMETITFTIHFNRDTQKFSASGSSIYDSTVYINTLYGEIQNVAGQTLPSTGGIGTTLFYVFGSLMACGAGVLLVTKKRMAV